MSNPKRSPPTNRVAAYLTAIGACSEAVAWANFYDFSSLQQAWGRDNPSSLSVSHRLWILLRHSSDQWQSPLRKHLARVCLTHSHLYSWSVDSLQGYTEGKFATPLAYAQDLERRMRRFYGGGAYIRPADIVDSSFLRQPCVFFSFNSGFQPYAVDTEVLLPLVWLEPSASMRNYPVAESLNQWFPYLFPYKSKDVPSISRDIVSRLPILPAPENEFCAEKLRTYFAS